MSYLQQQMNFLRFDKRLLEINLKKGTITEEEYQNHISNLQDDVDNSEKLDLASEAETEANKSSMNGDSHPAEPVADATPAPTNNDPFGSGF